MTDFLKNVCELDLYPPIIQYFKDRGYSIEFEIPIHRNRIDLIAYNSKQMIAVELKLRNWHRALRQAAYYQLGADLSYIAMPFYESIEVYKRKIQLEKEGVGLFGILLNKSEVRELVKPKISQKKIDYIERGIYTTIRRRH
ncbi:hypothetical protein [[Eubacterium] cellulosolvens]